MQSLPVGNFKWMTTNNIQTKMTLEKIRPLPEGSKRGYILEVNMYLSKECHEKMADYPVAPEKKPVHGTQLSHYQREILRAEMLCDIEMKINA